MQMNITHQRIFVMRFAIFLQNFPLLHVLRVLFFCNSKNVISNVIVMNSVHWTTSNLKRRTKDKLLLKIWRKLQRIFKKKGTHRIWTETEACPYKNSWICCIDDRRNNLGNMVQHTWSQRTTNQCRAKCIRKIFHYYVYNIL